MFIALFIAIAVVSMPIVAIVVVSMASRREEAAWSLGEPVQGTVQTAARRLLDFHSEDPSWPRPRNCGPARPAAPYSIAQGSVAQGSVAHPSGRTVTETVRPAATSKVSVGTAA